MRVRKIAILQLSILFASATYATNPFLDAPKGVGLVEYASGSGAHADGYRLKRAK